MKFRFSDFNHVRYGRGADAARVGVTNDDGESCLLWMSTQDIKKNVMLYGPHPGLLLAATHYNMNVPALVSSWRASTNKPFFRRMDPARSRDGWWTHPDWPSVEDGEMDILNSWLKVMELETATVWMLEDDNDAARDVTARWLNGDTDILAWEPQKPDGDGWYLVSIHDHEDGPVAIWLRDKPAEQAA